MLGTQLISRIKNGSATLIQPDGCRLSAGAGLRRRPGRGRGLSNVFMKGSAATPA